MLNLGGEQQQQQWHDLRETMKHKNHTNSHNLKQTSTQTDNNIGDSGACAVAETLKTNTTITELDLRCEQKNISTKHSKQIQTLLVPQ